MSNMKFDGLIEPIDLNSIAPQDGGSLSIGMPQPVVDGGTLNIGTPQPIPGAGTLNIGMPQPVVDGGTLKIGMPQPVPQGQTMDMSGLKIDPINSQPPTRNIGIARQAAQSGVIQPTNKPQMAKVPQPTGNRYYDSSGKVIGGVDRLVPINELTAEQKTRMANEKALQAAQGAPYEKPQTLMEKASDMYDSVINKMLDRINDRLGIKFDTVRRRQEKSYASGDFEAPPPVRESWRKAESKPISEYDDMSKPSAPPSKMEKIADYQQYAKKEAAMDAEEEERARKKREAQAKDKRYKARLKKRNARRAARGISKRMAKKFKKSME